jgi:PRTRC genetic system protein A
MLIAHETLEYLPSARDRILFAQTPMLMMPRHGELAPLPIGRRRYVAAADGIYVQARHRALDLTLRLVQVGLPYGVLSQRVELAGGLLPCALHQRITEHALLHFPKEWAGLVHWSDAAQRYELTIPDTIDASAGHIRYLSHSIDPERLVLDVHSHGAFPAFFSSVDNQSDQYGIYFASVFGCCQSTDSLTVVTRLVVDGHFFELDWHPWEETEDTPNAVAESRARAIVP